VRVYVLFQIRQVEQARECTVMVYCECVLGIDGGLTMIVILSTYWCLFVPDKADGGFEGVYFVPDNGEWWL
jgi:hypothetical protein